MGQKTVAMPNFLLSTIYPTRACPRHCSYCHIRNSNIKQELTIKEWKEAFKVMKNMYIPFNLILGNEPLMLGEGLVKLIKFFKEEQIQYGLYTTFPTSLFNKYKNKLLKAGLSNLSCGIDVLEDEVENDIIEKSICGLEGLKWGKENGISQLHATVTISKLNIVTYPEIVKKLTSLGIWTEVNVIHYAKDGEYDFFPSADEMTDLILTENDLPVLIQTSKIMKNEIEKGKVMLHNVPEYFDDLIKYGLNLDWHCQHPIILSVDSDGSLRLCAYRKGDRVSQFNILDFPEREDFLWNWDKDRDDCKGCFWSCAWSAEYYLKKNLQFAKGYFQTHASEYWRKQHE